MSLEQELNQHTGLKAIFDAAMVDIEKAGRPDELEAARVKYLGRKSELSLLLRSIPELPREERPVVGKLGNQLRAHLEQSLADRRQELEGGELEAIGRASCRERV